MRVKEIKSLRRRNFRQFHRLWHGFCYPSQAAYNRYNRISLTASRVGFAISHYSECACADVLMFFWFRQALAIEMEAAGGRREST